MAELIHNNIEEIKNGLFEIAEIKRLYAYSVKLPQLEDQVMDLRLLNRKLKKELARLKQK